MRRYRITIEDEITIARKAVVMVEAENAEAATKIGDTMISGLVYPENVSGQEAGRAIEFSENEIDIQPWEVTVEHAENREDFDRAAAEYPHLPDLQKAIIARRDVADDDNAGMLRIMAQAAQTAGQITEEQMWALIALSEIE